MFKKRANKNLNISLLFMNRSNRTRFPGASCDWGVSDIIGSWYHNSKWLTSTYLCSVYKTGAIENHLWRTTLSLSNLLDLILNLNTLWTCSEILNNRRTCPKFINKTNNFNGWVEELNLRNLPSEITPKKIFCWTKNDLVIN